MRRRTLRQPPCRSRRAREDDDIRASDEGLDETCAHETGPARNDAFPEGDGRGGGNCGAKRHRWRLGWRGGLRKETAPDGRDGKMKAFMAQEREDDKGGQMPCSASAWANAFSPPPTFGRIVLSCLEVELERLDGSLDAV